MVKIIPDIKPGGTSSAYVTAPFDEANLALTKKGYRIISLQENARLRMQEGADSFVSRNGNWTREEVVYNASKGIYLSKNLSHILRNAKEATSCHKSNQEYLLTDAQLEASLVDSVKLTSKEIPTERFGENEITVYVFGDDAQEYGDFLKSAGITKMPIWLANNKAKPFARQMWFRYIKGRSGLDCNGRYLDYNGRMLGV
jgi:hypothetical protein